MPALFNGKVVWITGASQGIGEAVARRLASEGARLALFARNIEKLKALAENLQTQYPNCECMVLPGDVRNAETLNAAVQQILKRWSQLDILINNAGVASQIGLLQEQSPEEVERVIDTNLKGAIYAIQAAIVPMVVQQAGCIININSIAGHTAFPYWGVYASSKFGLKAITESVAREQRQNGIKVCGIYPGAVDTPIWEGVSESLGEEARFSGMLSAECVANAIFFILSQNEQIWIPELTLEPLKPAL